MRTTVAIVIAIMLAAPLALAGPSSTNAGLANACQKASSVKPCEHLRLIPETTAPPGETRYANNTYRGEGTVTIPAGARVVVDNATIRFGPESAGFIVQGGGELVVKNARLEEDGDGSSFGIDAALGSVLSLTTSEVFGGNGVSVATDDAEIHHNRLSLIGVALRLHDVDLEIHHNRFDNNTVAANNTGGFPFYHNNTFEGGDFCIRDWYTDPTIRFNVFQGCHVGIWHERSESTLSDNVMRDDASPPGGGIVVMDTMSPTIERNNISNYGTGILIVNARAYVRENAIHHNVGSGIRVVANSAPMDIQLNHVYENGGDGIWLEDVSAMLVSGNNVGGNAGTGIRIDGAATLNVSSNLAVANAGHGIVVQDAPGILLLLNEADGNAGDGLAVLDSNGTAVLGGSATGNGGNGYAFVGAHESTLAAATSDGNAVGVYAGLTSGLAVSHVQATGSSYGFVVENASAFGGDNLSATGNGVGVWILESTGTLADANASGNTDGFRIERHSVAPPAAAAPTFDLVRARGFDNARYGLHNVAGNATAAQGAWWAGNGVAGVANDAPTWFDARHSYWGSSSGPTHADNPGGTGDAVLGNVLYDPYLTYPPGTPPPIYYYEYVD